MLKNQKLTGFTLLEVMLAMTLLSIMVVLLFSSLKIGAESWNKGEKKIAEVNEKAIVYQFFKRHLPSVMPLWDLAKDEHNFSFRGEQDNFQFVSIFPASASRKGLQLFKIGLDKSERNIIKVILTPFYPEIEGQEWQQEEVTLLENVETFELSYFALNGITPGGFWVSDWQEKENLPALIKIKIGLADQSYWPEMVFALKQTSQQPTNNFDGDSDSDE